MLIFYILHSSLFTAIFIKNDCRIVKSSDLDYYSWSGRFIKVKKEDLTMKDKIITTLFSRFPFLAERWAESFEAIKSEEIPWTPFKKELSQCKVALVTTAGVHLTGQPAFDMVDEEGDYSFREVPSDVKIDDIMITHKYYDHSDADRDINIVFPIERLMELSDLGEIKSVASRHFGVMGHIVGSKLRQLIEKTAPHIASSLKEDGVDIALLTPG